MGNPAFYQALILNCSQTLAGLKTGTVFNITRESDPVSGADIDLANRLLNRKGIWLCMTENTPGCPLVYVFRRSQLARDLNQDKARAILRTYGYPVPSGSDPVSVDECVAFLVRRLTKASGFPHEIGLFLGFPAEDVEGFIRNRGEGCRLCGYWKVYGNEQEAKRQFERFQKCAGIYRRSLNRQPNICRMTAAG
ncbi:MAG: DUF3793 family protein [Lachnospiraceae bacterium]|nr:DUF3793 family protein [Lachnospiraceae bacterium]